MDNVGRVHVVAPGEDLEHEVLQVIIREVLSRVDHTVHISLHEFRDDVDVFEIGGLGRLGHVQNLDDVLVVEELEQTDLTHDTFRINQILKGLRHLFDGHFDAAFVVVCRAHHSVGAMADLLNVLKLLLHTEGGACITQQIKIVSKD